MGAAILALAGCSSIETHKTTAAAAAASAAVAAHADFSGALRCMDTLLADFGTRDLSVIVEDIADARDKGGAGTKDMLIAVVSEMTQRSRAIRLVGSGKDWGNTVNYLAQTQNRESMAVVPQYALRGSISQADKASDLAVAIDLTVLTTQDMTVVPGVATRNAVVVSGNGGEIRKLGAAYGLPAAADRGKAVRALAELSAIELFGALAKVPYWTCLGATDANETVAVETQDWYDAMAARPAEIIKYFQAQLRQRRIYEGPIDGAVNPQFKDAVARYREVLGLSPEPKLSLDFFRAYLRADHYQLAARVPAPAAPVAVAAAVPAAVAAPTATPDAAPLGLNIAAANDARWFARGEAVRLTIRPSRDAHVYCFLQDEQRKIKRFFPNRFQRDSRVQLSDGLQLPGAMRFEILMNARGVPETVACFATEHDVLAQLPAGVNGGDFEPLPVASLEQVHSAFAKVADGALAQQSFELRAK